MQTFDNTVAQALSPTLHWQDACVLNDLVINSGVCALLNGQQVALFALRSKDEPQPSVFAVSNFDPIGKANVISRGIVGSIGDEPVVATPLYKQHFSLLSGQCFEQTQYQLTSYPARLVDDVVQVALVK